MKNLSVILLCCICGCLYAQQPVLDSLNRLYTNATTDSAKCYNLILIAKEFSKSNTDTSQKIAGKALQQAIQLKSDFLIIQAYITTGYNFSQQNDYVTAAKYFYDALRLSEKINNIDCIASSKNELAVLEKRKGDYAKTLSILMEINKLPKEQMKDWTIFKIYQNIGLCYATLNKPDSALMFYNMARPYGNTINNPFAHAMLMNNIAIVYLRTARFNEAIESYKQVIKMGENQHSNELLFLGNCNIGECYFKQDKFQEAIPWYIKSAPYAGALKNYEYMAYAYGSLVKCYENLGDYKNADTYFHYLSDIKDSAYLIENDKNLAEMETKYQTEKKENQIKLQQLELDQKNAMLFRERSFLIALVAGTIALIVFGYLFYNRYRLKQKQILNESLIREQQLGLAAVIEAQENERKRISKDLHDGLAQELVAIRMGLGQFQNSQHSEKYDQLLQELNNACTEVRNISHVMSPPTLESHGLPGSLEMLLRNSLGLAGIQHSFENLGVHERLQEKIEIGVYRIAQELVNNIIKHARASNVIMQLQKMGTNIILRVEDNGDGYDFESAKNKGSMGLLNILSRVKNLNGSFVAEPAIPKGTIAVVRIPVQ